MNEKDGLALEISSGQWLEDILKEIESGAFQIKIENISILLQKQKAEDAYTLLKKSLFKTPLFGSIEHSILQLVDFITKNEELSSQVRHVHNYVCHFSSTNLDDGIKADLYDVNQLCELIIDIEKYLIANH